MTREFLEIIEVSPRDGIQNEKTVLSTAQKLGLIGRALDAGTRRIEVTSFVNPARVPQMADADEVAARLPKGRAKHIGLALDFKGFERAAAPVRIERGPHVFPWHGARKENGSTFGSMT